MYRKVLRIGIVVAALTFFNEHISCAQGNVYKIHSLFMYNFTKHIQWTEIGEVFTIGVYGSDIALKEVKENFSGKKYSGKEFRVINIAGIGDLNTSDLVYMPKSNKNKILNLFEEADKNNTLFVSEDDLTAYGFPISFILINNKLSFKVSKSNLDNAGLKISSSLLSLAEVAD